MNICTYVQTYIYMYIHIHIYISTYLHIHIHTYVHIHICTYTHIHIYTYIRIYIYTYIHIYIYTYIHIYRYTSFSDATSRLVWRDYSGRRSKPGTLCTHTIDEPKGCIVEHPGANTHSRCSTCVSINRMGHVYVPFTRLIEITLLVFASFRSRASVDIGLERKKKQGHLIVRR